MSRWLKCQFGLCNCCYDEHPMGWLWFSIVLTLIAGAFGIYWAIIV